MTREELIEVMARAMLAYTKENAWSLLQVQGFRYGSDHVVRDCMLPPDAQEVWRTPVSNTSPEEMHHFIEQYCTERRMSAALAALEAAGVRLVPSEPSREMLLKAGATPDGVSPRGGTDYLGKMLPKYYAAMLAASPYAPPGG